MIFAPGRDEKYKMKNKDFCFSIMRKGWEFMAPGLFVFVSLQCAPDIG